MQELQAMIQEWLSDIDAFIDKKMKRSLTVERKSNSRDLVTEVDRAIEDYLARKIQREFPKAYIVGEESHKNVPKDLENIEDLWFIDPIDGTMNFVMQRNNFCVMLARYQNGEGTYGMIYDWGRGEIIEANRDEGIFLNGRQFKPPFKDRRIDQGLIAINEGMALADEFCLQDLIEKSQGLRLYGSAGLSIKALVKGGLLLYSSPNLQAWDIAPGLVMAREAGIQVSDIKGQPIDLADVSYPVLGFPATHREFCDHVRHYQENKGNSC